MISSHSDSTTASRGESIWRGVVSLVVVYRGGVVMLSEGVWLGVADRTLLDGARLVALS